MPSGIASEAGKPSRADASATAGMFASLIAASNARNSTGMAVTMRAPQRVRVMGADSIEMAVVMVGSFATRRRSARGFDRVVENFVTRRDHKASCGGGRAL